ncbi:hypothetical protein HBB16_06925 [Pseudonocardia sp. MCCB 268]|nr:hypothetical protein [Pseudonocardia cytotoxica]
MNTALDERPAEPVSPATLRSSGRSARVLPIADMWSRPCWPSCSAHCGCSR